MTIVTKSLPYALRSLYPGAFASYQGVVFRVTSPQTGALRGVTPDMSQTLSLGKKLAGGSGEKLLSIAALKIQSQIAEESGRIIPGLKNLQVIVPEKIDLRFDDTLDMIYCQDRSCGTLDRLSFSRIRSRDRMPICRRCQKTLVQQAPVWIPQRLPQRRSHALVGSAAAGVIRNMGTAQIFCYYSRPGDRCQHPASNDRKCVHDFLPKLGSLEMEDPQRPVDSLRRYNPHCPKGLEVPPIKLERLYRTGNYWYKMDFPRESMCVPLRVSAVDISPGSDDSEMEEVNEVLEEMKPLLFSSETVDLTRSRFTRLQVLELTYGFRIGNRFTGVSSYYPDGRRNEVIGRLTETQGFVMVLKPQFHELVERIAEEGGVSQDPKRLKEVALHSIKHALLVLAPTYTGFEPEKFHGSYDVLPPEEGAVVYVYDTDEGGNGGFAAIMNDRDNLLRMFKGIHQRLECRTRECANACKQCLFIKNCGNVNRKLNRNLVLATGVFLSN